MQGVWHCLSLLPHRPFVSYGRGPFAVVHPEAESLLHCAQTCAFSAALKNCPRSVHIPILPLSHCTLDMQFFLTYTSATCKRRPNAPAKSVAHHKYRSITSYECTSARPNKDHQNVCGQARQTHTKTQGSPPVYLASK